MFPSHDPIPLNEVAVTTPLTTTPALNVDIPDSTMIPLLNVESPTNVETPLTLIEVAPMPSAATPLKVENQLTTSEVTNPLLTNA